MQVNWYYDGSGHDKLNFSVLKVPILGVSLLFCEECGVFVFIVDDFFIIFSLTIAFEWAPRQSSWALLLIYGMITEHFCGFWLNAAKANTMTDTPVNATATENLSTEEYGNQYNNQYDRKCDN